MRPVRPPLDHADLIVEHLDEPERQLRMPDPERDKILSRKTTPNRRFGTDLRSQLTTHFHVELKLTCPKTTSVPFISAL
jgi:hypothetical protein